MSERVSERGKGWKSKYEFECERVKRRGERERVCDWVIVSKLVRVNGSVWKCQVLSKIK